MIVYMYLTILIVVSIITGIIVTVLEKRGLRVQQSSKISVVASPDKVSRSMKQTVNQDNPLTVIQPKDAIQKQLTVVIEPTQEVAPVVEESSVSKYDYDTPYIISIIDEEVL